MSVVHRLLPSVLAIACAAQAHAQDDDALLQTEQAILAANTVHADPNLDVTP